MNPNGVAGDGVVGFSAAQRAQEASLRSVFSNLPPSVCSQGTSLCHGSVACQFMDKHCPEFQSLVENQIPSPWPKEGLKLHRCSGIPFVVKGGLSPNGDLFSSNVWHAPAPDAPAAVSHRSGGLCCYSFGVSSRLKQ